MADGGDELVLRLHERRQTSSFLPELLILGAEAESLLAGQSPFEILRETPVGQDDRHEHQDVGSMDQ